VEESVELFEKILLLNNIAFSMRRQPACACSNYQPWEFVPTEKNTLLNRMFYYEFEKKEDFKDINKQLTPLIWEHYCKMRCGYIPIVSNYISNILF
jgi:hypothetical protein